MEVRSTQQCGNDAATAVAASINPLVESKASTDGTRAEVKMDLSRTTVNDETKPPLTRDESEYTPIVCILDSIIFPLMCQRKAHFEIVH